MKMRGMKIQEVADKMGCSPQFISNRLYRDSFTAADLIKIAEVLDCTLSFTLPDGTEIRLTADDLEKDSH